MDDDVLAFAVPDDAETRPEVVDGAVVGVSAEMGCTNRPMRPSLACARMPRLTTTPTAPHTTLTTTADQASCHPRRRMPQRYRRAP